MRLNSVLAFQTCIILVAASCALCSNARRDSHVPIPRDFLELFEKFEHGGYGLKRHVNRQAPVTPNAVITTTSRAQASPLTAPQTQPSATSTTQLSTERTTIKTTVKASTRYEDFKQIDHNGKVDDDDNDDDKYSDDADEDEDDEDIYDDVDEKYNGKPQGKKPVDDVDIGMGKNPMANANQHRNTQSTQRVHVIYPTFHFDIQKADSISHKHGGKKIVVQSNPEQMQAQLKATGSTIGTSIANPTNIENKIFAMLDHLVNGKPFGDSSELKKLSPPNPMLHGGYLAINNSTDKVDILRNALIEKLHRAEATTTTPTSSTAKANAVSAAPVRDSRKAFTQLELTVLWIFCGLLTGLVISGVVWAIVHLCNKNKKDGDDRFGNLGRTPPMSPVFMEMCRDKKTGKYVVNLHDSKPADDSSEEEMFNVSDRSPNFGRPRTSVRKPPPPTPKAQKGNRSQKDEMFE